MVIKKEVIVPTKRSIYITDYTTGETKRVETTTSPSGTTTSKTSYTSSPASSGGRVTTETPPVYTTEQRIEIQRNVAEFQQRSNAELVEENRERIERAKIQAGTYGKNLGYASELSILRSPEIITAEKIPAETRGSESISLYRGSSTPSNKAKPLGNFIVVKDSGAKDVTNEKLTGEEKFELESLSKAESFLGYESGTSGYAVRSFNPLKQTRAEINSVINNPAFLNVGGISVKQITEVLPKGTGVSGGIIGSVSKLSLSNILFYRENIKAGYQKGYKIGKFTGETAGVLIPKTPKQFGLVSGGFVLLSVSPPIVTAGVGAVFTYTGIKGAFNKNLTPQERVASGIVGVGSGVGTISTFTPFVKGGVTALSRERLKITKEDVEFGRFSNKASRDYYYDYEGFRTSFYSKTNLAVKELPKIQFINYPSTKQFYFSEGLKKPYEVKEQPLQFKIGLIPEDPFVTSKGKPITKFNLGAGAGEGALLRGAFGFTPKEQFIAFKGKYLKLTTSQRDIPIKDNIIAPDLEVSKFGLFYTPADPLTKNPQTRTSRLGLVDLFSIKKFSEISYGFVSSDKPQVFVTQDVKLGTRGTMIAPKGSTELEITSTYNLEILEKKPTIIKGQRVEVFKTKLVNPKEKPIKFTEGNIQAGDIIPSTYKYKSKTSFLTPASSGSVSKYFKSYTSSKSLKSGSSALSYKSLFSNRSYKTSSTSKYSSKISSPISYKSSSISSPISSPQSQSILSPPSKSSGKKPFGLIFSGGGKTPSTTSTYSVSIGKGKGTFKPLGSGLSLGRATYLGSSEVLKTPATKFKLKLEKGVPQSPATPRGFKRRSGLVFVEQGGLKL